MLRSIVIAPEPELSRQLTNRLASIGPMVAIAKTLTHYPEEMELIRLLRAHAPQVVFLSAGSMREAADTFILLERNAPGIQVIALAEKLDPKIMLEVMRTGIRELLAVPFDKDSVLELLGRISDNLSKKAVAISSTELLYSFLPSKGGVGTTTLALNSAIAASKMDNTKVLLADFDLNCGLVQFMLKLDNPHSIMEAAERSHEIDENLWPQLVTTLGHMDVLHAGRLDPQRRIEPLQIRNLLEFARRNYGVICADLSGNLERFSLDIMQESKAIFMVCTPEIPSLHLAKEKAMFLDHMNLGDRVRILLNRSHKRMLMSAVEIEELLGRPVHMIFPNEYANVHRAVTEGRPVHPDSPFGKQCADFAQSMLQKKQLATDTKRRFVQYFALAPAKYEFGGQ